MADALVSAVLNQLCSISYEQAKQEVRLVMGVDGEVENLRRNLEAIQTVLKDAEKRKMKEDAVRLWLDELKDVSYDMDDVLDEWVTAIFSLKFEKEEINGVVVENGSSGKKKVLFSVNFSCFQCGNLISEPGRRRKIGRKIENLNGRLESIRIRKESFNFNVASSSLDEAIRPNSTSMVDVPKVYGQDELKEVLVSRLLSGSGLDEKGHLEIIPIVGMGGIGKTTLAKQVFNDDKVKAHFGEERMWECVSQPFDEAKIANSIIEQVDGEAPLILGLESLMRVFLRCIKNKKFLLVLDDVWTDDYLKWEPLEQSLKHCAPGSKIVITTRNEEVAKMMGDSHLICMEKLSEEDCWLLFSEIAFFGKTQEEREDLKQIGKEIASKCKGLPLAAKSLGSLLRVKKTKEEWLSVLESEMWEIEKVKDKLFSAFLVSYYDLSPIEKCCFSYCAIFPKDVEIDKDDLIQQWMAQGYLSLKKNEEEEFVGRKCFESLAMRSFFQDFSYDSEGSIISCKMHDIVHDFAQFLTLNEYSIVTIDCARKRMDLNARHLVLVLPSAYIPVSVLKKKTLRTFVVLGPYVSTINSDLFSYLTRLRTLNLSSCSIKELPENIGKLLHLRYLNLSHNRDLKKLPSTIGNLCNLQTLRLVQCGLEKLPEKVAKLSNLRYLYVSSLSLSSLPRGIGRLRNLRTLNLSHCAIREIPENISELIYLRYLDLSENIELRYLPSTVGDLYNLRTLRLYNTGLENLPEEVAKLMNLRHLYVFSISLQSLPKGIGRLSNLQTLKDTYISDNIEMFQLQDLRHLDDLRDISLNGLGVEEHIGEAVHAQLNHKSNLLALKLIFMSGEDGDMEIQKNVLEALQPHSNLKHLLIYNYFGSVIFPSWMLSLINLKKLVLDFCPNCETIPPCGKLPFLESLEILLLESLRRLGPEFLGRETNDDSGEGTSHDNGLRHSVALFPKLKRLVLKRTTLLHEWVGIPGWRVDSSLRIMPRLEFLLLNNCWNLEALPNFLKATPLKHLIIEHSPKLEESCQRETGREWAKIRHIPCIQFTNDIGT
ncbi:putative disease resistance protein RGA1 [Humulus lupulus]|uniref:putative disease resistance protein RGA1 n=1 Tax=Humulus lupulus TaxID=3486 RepID=UPI002B417611|nr:putative disease resistance protein RGA1 [Humulus lupulus]XP_062076922.1 putative disease resistance protein RGA1 [Humulus lupulus]XP_062076923.1 putative disease resistance protein RGA1 [Humulus lupulus]